MVSIEIAEEIPRVNSSILSFWKQTFYKLISKEISVLTRYCDQVIQLQTRDTDTGALLKNIDCPKKSQLFGVEEIPDVSQNPDSRLAVLLSGNFNYHYDIQDLLQSVKPRLNRSSRLVVVIYNAYLNWCFKLVEGLGLKKGEPASTFITMTDLKNIAALSGYEVVRYRTAGYFPFKCLGMGSFINWILPVIPFVKHFSLVGIIYLRPIIPEKHNRLSLSVIIPARNEKGNIENAIKRLLDSDLGISLEVIFVEGHSTDGTWEEIQRVVKKRYPEIDMSCYHQEGVGKADSVRLGFQKAKGDLLTILDADLTMPPELLGRYYEAYRQGLGDFINGTRLVYPMEGKAMRFLNKLGNIFFAKTLSYVLGSRLGDSLCGTKLVSRRDYNRMVAWRKDFGDFDPFGDFELLFPASTMGLGIVDIPIRYRDRTYGSTSISRFRHGFHLLRMTVIGFFRIKVGKL